MEAPVLVYPSFSPDATEFVIQTDVSAVGLGVIVEQKGHLMIYASWSLTSSEHNYSVTQCQCLAIVFALKQFPRYLLGHPFQLCTDHAPLQWLSAQIMEGMLCRWSLAMQEYDFKIIYHKGSSNGNADALSHRPTEICAITICLPRYPLANSVLVNPIMIHCLLSFKLSLNSNNVPQVAKWNKPPFYRYKQIWHQLKVVDGVLCLDSIHPVLYTKKLL